MYILPQPYKCPKCDYEREWTPDSCWPAPVLETEEGQKKPACPRCWEKWIAANLGLMEQDGWN